MAISSANAQAGPKVLKKEMLTSGTSWTVPSGVEFVVATLVGGGGGGGGGNQSSYERGGMGLPGASIISTVNTTPGASITYAIGAGGSGGGSGGGSAGGTTTFTGATSAPGGNGGTGTSNTAGPVGSISFANNGGGNGAGSGTNIPGGAGGSGFIILEYWV